MEDLSVSVEGDILEIVAKRRVSHGGRVLHSERHTGEFRRALRLPFEVDGEKVEAHYGKGLLTIELSAQPKKGEKKIEILSGDKG
jgi:HSP20 family protein